MEGEKAWEAMGVMKTIDSPTWTQVRNDLTGKYQHATIGLEVMKTMMMSLLCGRSDEEEEVLQQFINCQFDEGNSEQSTEEEELE